MGTTWAQLRGGVFPGSARHSHRMRGGLAFSGLRSRDTRLSARHPFPSGIRSAWLPGKRGGEDPCLIRRVVPLPLVPTEYFLRLNIFAINCYRRWLYIPKGIRWCIKYRVETGWYEVMHAILFAGGKERPCLTDHRLTEMPRHSYMA